jgi:hypothetical protein
MRFAPQHSAAAAVLVLLGALGSPIATAKLPPLTDDAKAKAAEAAAKAAWGNKVADFQLCKSMDKVAVKYLAAMKSAGKEVKVTETRPCADPGPYVATPPAAAPAAAATPAASAPAVKS